ncbi:hypothetical protein MPF19_04785 [Polaribacter sp. Z014]|uniref:hypothetical protein n=1 Tax=Polaribacter sp. Z014 TaxID=2927126 RepID=UPI0020217514|nr:hypothetical protein [Polaribacter sp. Z014]MCL7762722.1 hypothetical protein [Polaribacter sp. Z014]
MQKQLLFILSFLIFISCGSVKSTQEAINNGNYDGAINIALENLKKNKTKKGNQPYVIMLEQAFVKANSKDLAKINFLKKDNNPESLETIFGLYANLKNRQENIKPLLPIAILEEGRDADFKFVNYDNEIIATKNQLSDHLYEKAKVLFNSNAKLDYRTAYSELEYLEKINPNYKDVRNLMEIAHQNGLDFVIVSMKNETEKIIPKKLEEDLLNFDTYGLNDFWTVYHGRKSRQITYDFSLELNLRNITVSPEQVKEKEIIKESQVKDGLKFLLDEKGKNVLDSEGNKVEVDKMVNIRCYLYQFTQLKTAKVVGQVKYVDLISRQVIETYPIESEFIFEHIYANYKGDKRALDKSYLDLVVLKVVPFPSNEQMVYDTGEDLKERLKYIITSNNFRN